MSLDLETPRPGMLSALHGLLRGHGLDIEHFEFEEHRSSGLSDLLGESEGILAVRCKSTGEERLYATGLDSAWLGALMMDLGSGHFRTLAARAT
jgi:hypothetical protein